MYDYSELLRENLEKLVSDYVITDLNWEILYRSPNLPISAALWEKCTEGYESDDEDLRGKEWEIADREAEQFYRVRTVSGMVDGTEVLIHHIMDVSDYVDLFRDLGRYSKEWRQLCSCQREILEQLSGVCQDCLGIAMNRMNIDCGVLYVDRDGVLSRYVLHKGEETPSRTTGVDFPDYLREKGTVDTLPEFGDMSFRCCCSGRVVSGTGYALYASFREKDTRADMNDAYFSMFRLYIENLLLQEKVKYESEHDGLTGLYNKMKYLELEKTVFSSAKSIALYNMDVNFLKRTNDTLGHEAGNKLLMKAADSMRPFLRENVYGFRMGGDEFLLVACDIEREEADGLLEGWRKELARLNETDRDIECIVACGMCYAKAPYDYKALSDEADGLMYAEKRRIKIGMGEDPDAR